MTSRLISDDWLGVTSVKSLRKYRMTKRRENYNSAVIFVIVKSQFYKQCHSLFKTTSKEFVKAR